MIQRTDIVSSTMSITLAWKELVRRYHTDAPIYFAIAFMILELISICHACCRSGCIFAKLNPFNFWDIISIATNLERGRMHLQSRGNYQFLPTMVFYFSNHTHLGAQLSLRIYDLRITVPKSFGFPMIPLELVLFQERCVQCNFTVVRLKCIGSGILLLC